MLRQNIANSKKCYCIKLSLMKLKVLFLILDIPR